MNTYLHSQVLKCLSGLEWKSTAEIGEALMSGSGNTPELFQPLLRGIIRTRFRPLKQVLQDLERQAVVESRFVPIKLTMPGQTQTLTVQSRQWRLIAGDHAW